MTGDTFDAILKLFPKIIPNATINSDGWWSFIGPFGSSKLKFYQNIEIYEQITHRLTWV